MRKIDRKRESPNRLEKVSLEECKWCEGTGIDSEGASLRNPYNCIDCRGTRFKEGEKAEKYYAYLMNSDERMWVKIIVLLEV